VASGWSDKRLLAGFGKQDVLTRIESAVFVRLMPVRQTNFSAGLGKQGVLTRIESSLRFLDATPTDKFFAGLGKQEVLTRIESSLRWFDAGPINKPLCWLGHARGADSNRAIASVARGWSDGQVFWPAWAN
jgi:hypothetical protein